MDSRRHRLCFYREKFLINVKLELTLITGIFQTYTLEGNAFEIHKLITKKRYVL